MGARFSIAPQGISNGFNNIDWGAVGMNALGGAVTGAITWPGGASEIFKIGLSFVLGGVAALAGGAISGSVNSLETVAMAFAIGCAANAVGMRASTKIASRKRSQIMRLRHSAKLRGINTLQERMKNIGALENIMETPCRKITTNDVIMMLEMNNLRLRFNMHSALISSALSGYIISSRIR